MDLFKRDAAAQRLIHHKDALVVRIVQQREDLLVGLFAELFQVHGVQAELD